MVGRRATSAKRDPPKVLASAQFPEQVRLLLQYNDINTITHVGRNQDLRDTLSFHMTFPTIGTIIGRRTILRHSHPRGPRPSTWAASSSNSRS
jgi:hypothetical protein